ncbi:MAG: copper resistance protein B [Pseudomonadota bacterium]
MTPGMYRGGLLVLSVLLLRFSHAHAQTAADAHYDPAAMAAAREALKESHGNQINGLFIAERLEYQVTDQENALIWEAQGWLGSDLHKLWVKSEGEYESEGRVEEAELQVLYSRAVSPFWDLQAGVRYDMEPSPERTHLVLGVQGLAPYWFEMDTALFLSDEGDVSARLEAEYEMFLTQRLILQPRLELNLAGSDDRELGLGRGFFDSVAELRLRYEFRREIAPYIGISWGGDFNRTADLIEQSGEDPQGFAIVAGLRVWF